ncbi:O-antigen ligase family protein [Clostridium sp. UBA4395]|uniref:O-antigen ligase family protein n=1 Tax=Clostridium sp. UBA4395 TaxID=1946360 RepID=UPI003216907D
MSWELYGQMLVSISSVCLIFSKNKSSDELLKFWETFSIITIITLIISIITGIGTTAWTGNRYHASNLTYGETGLLIGLFITYLLCVKDNQYKFIYSGISLVLLIATGSRKDIIYVLIVYVIYILNNVTSIKNLKIKTTFKSLAIHFFMVLLVGGMIIIRGNDLLEKLEVERTMNAINGLLTEGIHYIIEDSSGEGRIESIKSGIDVIKDNPLGVTFSFYNSQENMQLKQYPTFAHVSVIFYYIILGPLGIYIFYQYIKNYYHLNKIHNNFKYIYLYFIIYNCISGGALLNFKILISNIFILWIGNKLIIESKIKLNK